jgi:O-antigen/teichoic acid export membrane protein
LSPLPSQRGRHLLDGTVRVFLAWLLFPLTGIITAVFLTRRLGPEGYGLLVLSATLVVWIEWSINSFFARATIKFVGEAGDWRPIGATVIRLHLLVGGGAALVLGLLALPLARLLNEPVLVPYLCLFALDIPLSGLAHAHQNILVGIGSFRQKAVGSAGRWIARLFLILVLVEMGLSVPGAILGSIGASVVELVISRRYVSPPFFGQVAFPGRSFWDFGILLFLSALSLNGFSSLDLFMLKILGGTAQQAGIYGVAQNLSILPGLFAMSFSPLLLSTLSRMLSAGEAGPAKAMGRNAMRIVFCLLPIAAMVAGAAPEIVSLFFGPRFDLAAPLFAVLSFGAVAFVMISVVMAIVTAAGEPRLTLVLSVPLVPLAVVGHLVLIPRFGALGAAFVTTLCAGLGALACVLVVYRLWSILPPIGTLGRSVLVSVLAYVLAVLWPAAGLFVLLKLAVIGVVIVLAYLVFREFSADEIALARSFLSCKTTPVQHPHEV